MIIIKSIKKLLKIIPGLFAKAKRKFKFFFNFLLPNISFIIQGRLRKETYPFCDQITLLTGTGSIEIGVNCQFGYKPGGFHRGGSIEIQPRYKNAKIKIGNNVKTNNNVFITAANFIEIGDYTLIGQYVTIMDYEAHGTSPTNRNEIGGIGKVFIGKNVWIGNNVMILKNSEIGDNTVVAAGAIVSGMFPSNVIIGGVPAKIVKSI